MPIFSTDPNHSNYDSRLDPNSPEYSPEYEAVILADPNNTIQGPTGTSGGGKPPTQTPYMLSNGITMKQVMEVMKRWQDPTADQEKLNQFLAWYSWYKKRYAFLFDASETVRDHRNDTDSTVSKETIARWTALVSAAAKVDTPAPEGTQLEGDAFIVAPEPD